MTSNWFNIAFDRVLCTLRSFNNIMLGFVGIILWYFILREILKAVRPEAEFVDDEPTPGQSKNEVPTKMAQDLDAHDPDANGPLNRGDQI